MDNKFITGEHNIYFLKNSDWFNENLINKIDTCIKTYEFNEKNKDNPIIGLAISSLISLGALYYSSGILDKNNPSNLYYILYFLITIIVCVSIFTLTYKYLWGKYLIKLFEQRPLDKPDLNQEIRLKIFNKFHVIYSYIENIENSIENKKNKRIYELYFDGCINDIEILSTTLKSIKDNTFNKYNNFLGEICYELIEKIAKIRPTLSANNNYKDRLEIVLTDLGIESTQV